MSNQQRFSGEWETKRLGDICNPQGIVRGPFGGTLKKDTFVTSGFKVYQQQNAIYKSTEFGTYFIDQSKYTEMQRFSVTPGDFIVSCSGTIGRIFQLPSDAPQGVINQALLKLTTNDTVVYDQYFYILFEWDEFQIRIIDSTQGGAIRNLVGMDIFKTISVVLPPLSEQRAIAEVLSDVDGLINALDALIAKKRAIKQATMQQLLTGKTRLPGFSGEWETKRLGEIGEISGAGVDKKVNSNEVPVRLVNYLDVYNKTFLYSKDLTHEVTAKLEKVRHCAVEKGDVFFTPSSEVPDDIGTSAVAIEDISDGVYSYHIVRLRLKTDWDIYFRAYIFNTKEFLDQASRQCEGSGTRYVISLPKFRAMTVRFPPSLDEQRAIAAVLTDIDAEIAALEQRRDKTIAIKQGMMQQLLTGKVRLLKQNR